jgi:PTS system galactitol-specific IIA component
MSSELSSAQPDFISELCEVRPDVSTSVELLERLAASAYRAGYVQPGFAARLLEREDEFPTGLPTATPVAIPHVEAEHVLKPGLVAVALDPPLTFREMGSPDRTVEATLVVLLLVTDPAAQVPTLGRLIALFQDPRLATTVTATTDGDDLARVLNRRWRDG